MSKMSNFCKTFFVFFLMAGLFSCSMVKKLHHSDKQKTEIKKDSSSQTLTTIKSTEDTAIHHAPEKVSESKSLENLLKGETIDVSKNGLHAKGKYNPQTKNIEVEADKDSSTDHIKFNKEVTIKQTSQVHSTESKKSKQVDNSKDKKTIGGFLYWLIPLIIALLVIGYLARSKLLKL